MNHIQAISQRIMTRRLKLQMGISLSTPVDPLTLRVMWKQLERERQQQLADERFRDDLDDSESAFRLYSTE